MFGKRKPKDQPQQPGGAAGASASRFELPTAAGKLGTVIVPRSAIARAGESGNYDLVQALVNFVNAMTGEGLYSRFELEQKAMQSFHADFYLAQVNNGGHSQFIHNSFGNLPFVIADVRAGLAAMKAHAFVPVFEKMAAWVEKNPDEAKKQTGFEGGRAALLDELDTAFYKADKETALITLNSRWIATWPELRPVDDNDYREAIQRVVMLNPLREQRLLHRSVMTLTTQMIDWLQVGTGLACANGPEVELRLGLGGGSYRDVDGRQEMVWLVQTNAGRRFCVVSKESAAMYEINEPNNPPMPKPGDTDGMMAAIKDGRLAKYKAPTVGKRLSFVKKEQVAGVIELATDYLAPLAIDLALRKAGINPLGATVAAKEIQPNVKGPIINWIIAADGQPFFGASTPSGTAIWRPQDNKQSSSVTKAEAEAHAKKVAEGKIAAPE